MNVIATVDKLNSTYLIISAMMKNRKVLGSDDAFKEREEKNCADLVIAAQLKHPHLPVDRPTTRQS